MSAELIHLPQKVDLEGANNFRDLGGYINTRGQTLRQGLVYRSDHLGRLSDRDQNLLRELRVASVVDLRRSNEREEFPDRVDDPLILQRWLPIQAEGTDVNRLRRLLESGELDSAGARNYLIEANRDFVLQFAHLFGDFLRHLLEPANLPCVVHCTAGKDRAGFAAACLLMALDMSVETVFHDYLASNHCLANYVNGLADAIADDPNINVDIATMKTLMGVEVEFLQTALDRVQAKYGGVSGFIRRGLGLTEAEQLALQERLLTP